MTRPLGVHQTLRLPPVAALTLIVVMIQVSPPSQVSAPARRLVPVPLQPLPHAVTANPASTVHTVRRVRRRSTDQRKSLGPKPRPRAGPRPGASACPFLRPRRPRNKNRDKKDRRIVRKITHTSLDPSTGKSNKIYGMDVAKKQIRRVLCPPGVEEGLQAEYFDIMTDTVSAPGTYANPRANNDDGGMADYVAALTQAVAPGTYERTTPPDKKYNTVGRHPLRQAGVDEETFGLYMDEYRECFPLDMIEFGENTTNYCHAHTTMGDKLILEYVNNGPTRVLINRMHELLAELQEKIRRLS